MLDVADRVLEMRDGHLEAVERAGAGPITGGALPR
jgi:hypothetical protein